MNKSEVRINLPKERKKYFQSKPKNKIQEEKEERLYAKAEIH